MSLNTLTENTSTKYDNHNIDYTKFEEVKNYTSDNNYFHLITEVTNGGYFFSNSLHLYGYGDVPDYHDIDIINKLLRKEYGNIYEGLYSFGEDIFGNQFVFSSKGIMFFNIETGDKEYLGETFSEWLEILNSDISYYSGKNFAGHLNNPNGNRLCPKIPFVIGGEYDVKNLYSLQSPNYILVNANIARQIYNLPEGTNIELKTTD